MSKVAVFLHGIMGAELWLGRELIWPGSFGSLIWTYGKIAELLSEDLVVGDVIRRYGIVNQYGFLLDDLGLCGFSETDTPPTLYVCAYDWRRSNIDASDKLADVLDRAVQEHGHEIEIVLIAHSMGGLVARCYLESGKYVARAAHARVSALITLGTPHRGSPIALTAARGEEKRVFLNKEQVHQLASDPRYPSLYELLPPEDEPFVWDEGDGSIFHPVNIYDPQVGGRLGLVSENLDAAKEFHSSIGLDKRPEGTRYFFFSGTHHETTSMILIAVDHGEYRVRKRDLDNAGDGTVPVWSSMITGVQGRPVGGDHGEIYKNWDLRQTLWGLLGKPVTLAAPTSSIEVAARDQVVEPSAELNVSVSVLAGASELRGELRFEMATLDPNGNVKSFKHYGKSYGVSYTGAVVEKITVNLPAPDVSGLYQLAFYKVGENEPAGKDELFVQEPLE
jgi:pimeloyl-ACP methyl ester carboxylesterase